MPSGGKGLGETIGGIGGKKSRRLFENIDPIAKGLDKVFFPGTDPLPALPEQSPAPTQAAPEIEIAQRNLRERLKRARGRAASRTTSPQLSLQPATVNRPGLSDRLA